MGQLIEDMLLLHRVTRTPLQSEVVDLSRICDNVIQGLREREPARNVTIEVDRDMQTVGDPKLLELALSHLISNAWKFSANRADAWIKIGHKSLPGQHEEVFFVSDNGAGFDMAYADKLFVAFQRLHSTLQFPGTGVGLAIVQRVVARHGGEIWAESQPGMGSTFYFTLSGAEDNELELEVYHHVTE
jgi:light-regulated signal transduction histidine kinase (bacteriophytochrome)